MMVEAAAWIALIATCLAALLTAANLGARPTGWGFVIFTIGAIAWITVGLETGQRQLLFSNLFLAIVDIFGVWRWLGRRARIDDSAASEEKRSEAEEGENRLSLLKLAGRPVRTIDGVRVAEVTDALIGCDGGRVSYLVVARGGLGGMGETLHRLPWQSVSVERDDIWTTLSDAEFARLPIVSRQ